MKVMRLLALVAGVSVSARAQEPLPHFPPLRTSPRAVLGRFLAAERAGNVAKTDDLMLCSGHALAADTDAVTTSVRVLPSRIDHDTVLFTVLYRVVGRFWRIPGSGPASGTARFVLAPRVDTATFAVIPYLRRFRVLECGGYAINHVAASARARFASFLDASSMTAWRSAHLPVR